MADWIDNLSTAQELAEAEAEAKSAKLRLASKAIASDSPEFLRRLETELREIGRRLSEKPKLRLSLNLAIDTDPEVETRLILRVTLTENGWQETAQTNIYHGVGEKLIRCHPQEDAPLNLRFAARNSDWTVGVYAENEKSLLMTPEQAADYIVKPMVKKVRGIV